MKLFTQIPTNDTMRERISPPLSKVARTLYHGTIVDNKESIESIGLVPSVGEFIKEMYGDLDLDGMDEEYGALVYAASRDGLQQVANAIEHQVAAKLGIPSYKVTEQNIWQHGLLAVIKDGECQMSHSSAVSEYEKEDKPYLEPDDWFSEDCVGVDFFLTGGALIRFFKSRGITFGPRDFFGKLREKLKNLAYKYHGVTTQVDKDKIDAKIAATEDRLIEPYIDRYEKLLYDKSAREEDVWKGSWRK